MLNLVTIQKVENIRPIEGADSIEVARVLGWSVVVKKGEFKIGDSIVYVAIDTILPEKPEFEFLRNKQYRIRTCKLRGQVSQGICFPLSILPPGAYRVGADVTALIGAQKYEKPIPVQMAGQIHGNFPHLFPKTDELNLLSYPDALQELAGKEYYITIKMDGTSCSIFYKDGDFGVCSRNWRLKDDGQNIYWKIAKKFDLQNKLNKNVCVQCEIVAPGIQKGRTGDKELTAYVFDVYDIDNQRYFNYWEMDQFCFENKLTHVYWVPHPEVGKRSFNLSIDRLKELADDNYPDTNLPIEGIVVRPQIPCMSEVLQGRLSFKVLNEKFLLKYGE